jgi:hypothetical protein
MALAGFDVAATALATGVNVATAAKTVAEAKRLVMAAGILERFVTLMNDINCGPKAVTTVQALDSDRGTCAKVHIY